MFHTWRRIRRLQFQKSDLEYLREIFLTRFKFESNVVLLDVTFQKFDAEWNEFIDLESGDEACHKDKLKAVVGPNLAQDTPGPSRACSQVLTLSLSLTLSFSLSLSHSLSLSLSFSLSLSPLVSFVVYLISVYVYRNTTTYVSSTHI